MKDYLKLIIGILALGTLIYMVQKDGKRKPAEESKIKQSAVAFSPNFLETTDVLS